MQRTAKRTPRACEHCRKTRRRCEPPYPCQQCVTAGVTCNVRAKARPQRRQQQRRTVSGLWEDSNDDNARDSNRQRAAGRARSPISLHTGNDASREPASVAQSRRVPDQTSSKTQGDTFELLKGLVQDMLLERHGHVMDCPLIEPPSYSSTVSIVTQSDLHRPSPLNSAHIRHLLSAFRKFVGWQDVELVNVEHLHATAGRLAEHTDLLNFKLSPPQISQAVTMHHLPVDSVALIFGALSLGAVAGGEFGHGRFYFDISTETVKHFVGQPTLELCLAYFLQHEFALRAGTSNYAQGIIAQAIQNAHDLGLHMNSYGIRGLQLYLLIYMADQYCSLTHNTEPTIRTSKLPADVFAPLSQAEPQLRTLVDLVTINGYVIEHSQQLSSSSPADIFELEDRISTVCSKQVGPIPAHSSCGSFRTAYEPLARVHMLCCRLKLRAPGLSKQASWLPSLCICVHAAEGVLSTYFELYLPVLGVLARQRNMEETYTDKSPTPIACKLAPTWRQVRRIMMSVFVVVFAYWHGEMVHREASRYVAMARLLFEYPRWRWGEKLDEALQTLVDISKLSNFQLHEQMQSLLPGVSERFPRPFRETALADADPLAAAPNLSTDQTTPHEDMFSMSSMSVPYWPSPFASISNDGLAGSESSVVEDQTLLGLWETIECPVESSFWMSNPC